MTIAALQFLEQGMELGAHLEQTATVIASQIVAHGKGAHGVLVHAYHVSEMVQHLVTTVQGFAHRASWLPVLAAPVRPGIIFVGRCSSAAPTSDGICWQFRMSRDN
jgi:hypothetical protein